MKKKLLLVIKDPLEFKFIMNDHFLSPLLQKFEVHLMCPVNKDSLFRDKVLSEYPSLKFLNVWPDKEVCSLDRFIYWLKTELYFFLNAYKSESCFQKVFVNLEVPLSLLLKKDLAPHFVKLFSHVFNSKLEKVLRLPVFCMGMALRPFKKHIFSHNKFFTSVRLLQRDSFDYIIWGRSYSLVNIAIHKLFSGPDTKIITLCRNFDTPALKGIYTIPSHYTIVFDKFLYEHLSVLNHPLNYGQVILYEHPVRFFKKQRKETSGKYKVLYATTLPHFTPNQDDIVEALYNVLLRMFGTKFTLTVRIHPDDDTSNYKKFIAVDNIVIDERLYNSSFESFAGRRELFPTPTEVSDFYSQLQEFDFVLSNGSTINYEAYLLGIKNAFLELNNEDAWKFRRDHLKILVERCGIPLLKKLKCLEDLFLCVQEGQHSICH